MELWTKTLNSGGGIRRRRKLSRFGWWGPSRLNWGLVVGRSCGWQATRVMGPCRCGPGPDNRTLMRADVKVFLLLLQRRFITGVFGPRGLGLKVHSLKTRDDTHRDWT